MEHSGILAGAPPRDVFSGSALWKVREFGRFLAVIEKLIERDFQGSGELFKGLDRRNRVAVFDARNVAAEQTRALFNVALRKILLFP
jgi:hypothetical protein